MSSMDNKCSAEKVSLKKAFRDGILLDLLLFAMANLVLDGGETAGRTFLLVIAHLTFSIWLALHKKGSLSQHACDFIRFGILLLALIAFLARYALALLGKI